MALMGVVPSPAKLIPVYMHSIPVYEHQHPFSHLSIMFISRDVNTSTDV